MNVIAFPTEKAREPYVGIGEAQRFLCLDRKTIYKLILTCRLPARKLGGHWRFRLSELEAWVNNQEGQSWPQ